MLMARSNALLACDEPEVDLVVGCSSGTYIRSLARDLAEAVDSLGHILHLRRLDVGPFSLDNAVSGVMEMSGQEILAHLLPLNAALPQTPAMTLTDDEAVTVRVGGQPKSEWLERLDGQPVAMPKSEPLFRMVDTGGELVAVGRLDTATGEPRIAVGIPAQD